MRTRILLVARDVPLRARLARLLKGAGYGVELAENAAHASRIGFVGIAAAVVAPDGPGAEAKSLIAELEANSVKTLTLGVEPGSLDPSDETGLLQRIAEAVRPSPVAETPEPVLCFGGFRLDLAGHSLTDAAGNEIALTRGEFNLLREFAQRPGRVLSRDRLLNALAGRDAESYDRTCSPMVHIEELLALSTKHGFPYYLGWGEAFRGRSLIALGQLREGLALITQALKQLRATGGVVSTSMLLTWLAEAYALLGQPAEALSYLAEAKRIVEITEERYLEAELLYRVEGDLLNATGDLSAAEQHYCQAIVVAERQSAKLFQLRASTSLARLWRDQGRSADARDVLAPIYNWFTEGFDAPDLIEAKALLDELRGQSHPC